MRQLLAPSAAFLAVFAPLPALADLTADDVWTNWKTYLEATGYAVEVGSQEEVGSSLILRDVALTILSDDADMRASIANMEFRELGDGRVEISMASDIPFAISADEEDTEVDVAMIIRQAGLLVLAAGDPDDVTYDLSAQSVSGEFDKFIVDGEQFEPNLRFAMTGIKGQTNMKTDGGWHASGFANADTISAAFDFTDPDSGDAASLLFSMADLSSQSTTFLPEDFDPMNPAAIFGAGMKAVGSASFADLQVNLSLSGDDAFDLVASAASQDLSYALQDGSIAYETVSKGLNYNFSSPQLPFPPINVSIDESEGAIRFPMAMSDDAEDFRMMFSLRNLSTEEFLWSMIDPAGMLPRDPASIRVDISGKIRTLIDIFDPETVEAFDGEMPFELESLDINDISLSIAGAAVDASGGFTFDNSDLETFDGMPAPTGGIDVNIFGLNGLMDTLVQMGLLPDDQAMGARMMLGAFARPGEGEDHLQSTIEVQGDGSVFANGMQLQ